ncbi:MAG: hypothetical protein ACK5XA_15635 [Tagaea sp.]
MPIFVTRTDISPGTTGSWQDVDVSALVPAGATGVILRVLNTSAIAPSAVGWRKKGSTDNRTGTLYVLSQTQAHVGVDGSRVLQLYRGATDIQFSLEGHWGSEAVFFDNAVSKTPGGGYSWTAASIASDTGADTAIAAFVEFAGTWAALRKTGSSDSRSGGINAHAGGMIGVNGSESFDYQTEGGSNPVFVLGYLKSGATIATNGTDRSTATTGSYQDVAAFASGNVAALYEMASTGSGAIALRKKGDAGDLNYTPGGANIGWFVIEGDASRIVQQKIAATDSDLWELGVFAENIVLSYARPNADGSTKQWTASSGTDYFPLLDETSPGASDYIYATASGQIGEIKFSMAAPKSGTSFDVGYAVDAPVGAATVTAKLYVGAALIKTDTARSSAGTYTMTVTSGDYAGVSNPADWSNVTLRFESA